MFILPLKAGKDQGEERLLTQKRHTTKEVVTVRKNGLHPGATVNLSSRLPALVYLLLDKGQNGKPPEKTQEGNTFLYFTRLKSHWRSL